MAGNGLQPRHSVTSKVVAILRSFSSGGSLTVTEIAHVAGLPLSTTHRLVHELAAWGLVHRGPDARYGIVPQEQVGGCSDAPPDLHTVAAPLVEDLSGVTHSDVRLGLLDQLRVRYAEKADDCRPFSAFSCAATLPIHATALGKALLAFSPPDTVEHVIRHGLRGYTSATITTAGRLRQALRLSKLQGMAVARGELVADHAAVAVPVFGGGGEVLAALEVRLPDVPGDLSSVVPALTVAARALSRELGRITPSPAAAGPGPGRALPGGAHLAPPVHRRRRSSSEE